MTREELKLNDFEGFDRYLKTLETEEKTGWGTFYDEETEIFTPPILKPETLPEYQLDHYALWMVICTYDLQKKPRFCNGAYRPIVACYACEWAKYKVREICRLGCPMIMDRQDIDLTRPGIYCVSEFIHWYDSRDKESAYNLAHLEWRET